jgi:hypothetical protein
MCIAFATDNRAVHSPAKGQKDPVGWACAILRFAINTNSALRTKLQLSARPTKRDFIAGDLIGHKNLKKHPRLACWPVSIRTFQFQH